MRDVWGGISADFLHIAARQDKFSTRRRGKRDCADNPFDKLPTESRKPLMPGDLSGAMPALQDMLMDVNKRARMRGRHCV